MIIPGLVSVTFRQKSPLEICRLCEKAQLKAIEWGGDVHVPPNAGNIREIRDMSADHGLTVCTYGSYYRVTQPIDELRACLDAANQLGTEAVRIWGGVKGSHELGSERGMVIDSLLRCAEEARARSLRLALEYHGGTLTDSRESVCSLLRETAQAADVISCHWQPRWDWPEAERLAALDDVRGRLCHLHVFTWSHENNQITRHPLEDGAEMWRGVLSSFTEDRYGLIEFVQNDSDEALLRDAAALTGWIR